MQLFRPLHIKFILKPFQFIPIPHYFFANPQSPKDIQIPKDKIELKFSRSSGPGGQNVNKVNTKAEIRFNVDTADWLQSEVKQKLRDLYKNSINLKGEIIVTSQVYRTQEQNLDDAYKKLRDMVFHASLTEKERKFLIPPETENLAKRRIESKRKKGDIKKTRSGGRDY